MSLKHKTQSQWAKSMIKSGLSKDASNRAELEDILSRRLRIAIEYGDRGVNAAPAVADFVAPLLGWSDADKEREVSQFKAHTQAELEAEAAVTDREANDILVRAGSARPTQNEV